MKLSAPKIPADASSFLIAAKVQSVTIQVFTISATNILRERGEAETELENDSCTINVLGMKTSPWYHFPS